MYEYECETGTTDNAKGNMLAKSLEHAYEILESRNYVRIIYVRKVDYRANCL